MNYSPPVALFLTLAILASCAPEFKPPPKKKDKEKSKNIVRMQVTVPYGKKVACRDIYSNEEMSVYLSDLVRVVERSQTNIEATAACAILREGETPNTAAKYKPKQSKQVLGVQPGDEYCSIALYCFLPVTDENFRKRCEDKGHLSNHELHQYSCVERFARAEKFSYRYKTIHKLTNCVVEVMGGPSVTDEKLVQDCTRGALTELTKDKLKKFK